MVCCYGDESGGGVSQPQHAPLCVCVHVFEELPYATSGFSLEDVTAHAGIDIMVHTTSAPLTMSLPPNFIPVASHGLAALHMPAED